MIYNGWYASDVYCVQFQISRIYKLVEPGIICRNSWSYQYTAIAKRRYT